MRSAKLRDKDEAARRKAIPVYSGFVKYFPDAILAVAALSKIGNDQHNPGKPLHWDRSKSADELDALMRHMIDDAKGEPVDNDGVLHKTKVAWRALADLQKALENSKTQKLAQSDMPAWRDPSDAHRLRLTYIERLNSGWKGDTE